MVAVASLFSQLLDLFPRREFESAVRATRADRYAKSFRCWDQFVGMLFCQLAQAHSLREICGGLACCLGKLRHLGVTTAPNKSTLAYANAHRPWQLYQAVFEQLLPKCQVLAKGRTKFRFKSKLYMLDSTIVDLCLSMFDWARFRRTKGAIKLHLLLDHEGCLPTFGVVTDGKVHDMTVARSLQFPAGSVVVVDRGYADYRLFSRWTTEGIRFVTRLKGNVLYRVIERRPVRKDQGVYCDQVIELTGLVSQRKYPQRLRRVRYRDAETGRMLVFITNQMTFAAATIARIYKERWQIELFFKALKQNLRIKTFVGTSANAVRIQIWTALIAMLLLKYLQFKARLGWSLSNLVALLRWNLFTYRNLWTWLDDPYETPPLGAPVEQMALGLGSWDSRR
jgi:hypothetical protein